jgi:MFS family permease
MVTTGNRRLPIGVILAITAAGMTTTAMVSPVVPDVLREYDQSASRAGLVVAAATLPAIIGSPVVGVLADRFGRLRVLRPCLALFGLLGTASAFSPNFTTLLALRFLQGFPTAGLIVLAIVLVSDQWQGRERMKQLGRNAAVLTGSLALLPFIGGIVAATVGWRGVFAMYALAPLVLIPLRGHRDPPAERAEDDLGSESADEVATSRGAIGLLLRTGRIPLALAAGAVTLALGFGWGVTLLPVHAQDHLALGSAARGALVATSAVVATAVALRAEGPLSRFSLERIMVFALACFGIGWLIVAVADRSVPLVVVGIAITGLPQGIVLPALQATIAADAPDRFRGTALSLWGMSIRVGQTVGPVVIVMLLLSLSTLGVFLVGALSTLVGAVLLQWWLVLHERKRKGRIPT